jgi:hypothetical protein
MSNTIVLKKSSVAAKVPQTADLAYGEVALNYADGKLYFKSSSNAINFLGSSSATDTFSNKTIALGSNTVSGTLAQFNTALTDADFASLAGVETLSNKTLASPIFSGSITIGGVTGTSGQVIMSNGSGGISWSTPSAGALSNLSDVVISSPQAQQVLKYNGTQWVNAASDTAVASAVFAPQAMSDLGSVTDSIIGISEDLGSVTQIAYYVYDMGQLRLDGIASLSNIDQSVKADYIGYSIIFGF